MRKSLPTFSAFVVVALVGFEGLAASRLARTQTNAIRVQTNLVSILASVTDASGTPVTGLTQDAFTLSEEGVPQKIERFEAETSRPVDLALMIDVSASTYKDLKFESDAAARFIAQVVRPADSLAVFEFSEDVTELAGFSSDVPRLQEAVHKITPGAGTSIYDAIVLSSKTLRWRPTDRRRAIILVTDAGETTSVSKFEDARHAAIVSDALLYVILIRPVKNESGRNTAGEHALITIMDSTGGGMFTLDDFSQLGAMFTRIQNELRTQYLLGYYPHPDPPPGSDRHVHLTVKSPYTVRYRSEYFTASP
jgi:Ca-activated chloride channel homolog